VAYHSTQQKLVEDQIRIARPIDATAGERMDGSRR
jgi:hypothetical protein